MSLIWWITGGRPMQNDGLSFVDVVSGRGVYNFVDKMGRKWMAESAWAWFRVKRN